MKTPLTDDEKELLFSKDLTPREVQLVCLATIVAYNKTADWLLEKSNYWDVADGGRWNYAAEKIYNWSGGWRVHMNEVMAVSAKP